ncbi:MAG: IS30 family transposase [Solobacterium sp.]|nr:IS30 family transposase [Solobacterium sp.]
MSKNFKFSERIKLEHHLNIRQDCSAIKLAKILDKSRSTIYYELKHFRSISSSKFERFNHTNDNWKCPNLQRFPFVCNGCVNTRCSHRNTFYNAYEADRKANHLLHNSRTNQKRRSDVIRVLNRSVCPLIKDGVSIHVAMHSVNNCDLSESTIRRYIELGLVDAKRIDLPRAVKFRAKKEYKYTTPPLSPNILDGRTYDDYLRYMDSYPQSKVVQLDSVIGKSNDKKAILTVFFKNSKLQLGYLYTRKHSNVVDTMRKLYQIGKDNGVTLFNVVLADNGSEFKSLHELEFDNETGEQICHVFYCDPYRSCQKAECEKNHGFFRRIWPKGQSLDHFTQENVDEIFSHINSYPRKSLNNKSPIDLFILEYKLIILSILNIVKYAVSKIKMINYKKWRNMNHDK